LQRLSAQTNNRTAYIERLLVEELGTYGSPEQVTQMQAKLTQRCQHFPAPAARTIEQIRETRGVQAALEASEAVALVLDPSRSIIP
jgi:hypothetical protein